MNTGTDSTARMDRREAIKWMATAAASVALLERTSFGQGAGRPEAVGGATALAPIDAKGYGTDPDLIKDYKPGDVWPLTLTDAQRATTIALCDAIIPADEHGPAASAVKVHDFVDEWISAPYPGHGDDRTLVLEGLAWIDAEAQRRFGAGFAQLRAQQQAAICDDICYAPKAKPEFAAGARFFKRFRDLTAGGYYTTPEGMKDIGYRGNIASATYDGPTPEALKHLGLA